MKKINRKILEKVLKIELPVEENITIKNDIVFYEEKTGFYQNDIEEKQITLTDLAKKCKYYLLDYDCQLVSCVKKIKSETEEYIRGVCDIYSSKKELNCSYSHYGENEELAILKATEWLIEATE